MCIIPPGERSSQKSLRREQPLPGLSSVFSVSLLSSPGPKNERKRTVTEKILKACAKGEMALNDRRPLTGKSRERRRKKREKEKMAHVTAKQKLTSNPTPLAKAPAREPLQGKGCVPQVAFTVSSPRHRTSCPVTRHTTQVPSIFARAASSLLTVGRFPVGQFPSQPVVIFVNASQLLDIPGTQRHQLVQESLQRFPLGC